MQRTDSFEEKRNWTELIIREAGKCQLAKAQGKRVNKVHDQHSQHDNCMYLFFMSNIEIYKSHFKNDHAKTFWMKIFEIL